MSYHFYWQWLLPVLFPFFPVLIIPPTPFIPCLIHKPWAFVMCGDRSSKISFNMRMGFTRLVALSALCMTVVIPMWPNVSCALRFEESVLMAEAFLPHKRRIDTAARRACYSRKGLDTIYYHTVVNTACVIVNMV